MTDRNQMTLTFHNVERFKRLRRRFEIMNYEFIEKHDVRKSDIHEAMAVVAFENEEQLRNEVYRLASTDAE